ncbi:DMT family transporter [Mesorhizobium sp. VK23B]|uniref:DMT family transporter n=1 Tax=Mesorhizobium dulcispinae TaxID=3072316 RepID=A0ABU4XAN6_9HYPH|nr:MULTISPECIES: DMT family transporter [unclassified Mesorhizobium]MDX8466040.1 DMT family transporter [Mesorhizobium sp. VK23B]MDX8471851.1 DMT family transporter [Mesorhizobium sp. VK23A]MDX8520725.1 DMT family transporter [Mesorhizobium sp. VK23D]
MVDAVQVETGSRRDARLGVVLVLAAALAWSTMGLFVRMLPDVDIWNVVFWRCTFGGPSIVALAMMERKRWSLDWPRTVMPAGIATTALIATGLFCSIYSMQNTTIANGGVIYSTVPFMAAVLAWLWFRERPGASTIFCTFVAVAGVAVTVRGTVSAGGGHLKGDLAMVYVAFAIAMMTVTMRRYRDTPMLESAALGNIVAAIFAFSFADPFNIPLGKVALLGLFGIITQGVALGLYTMGARRLPAAQATLLSSAEMPMGPLWVWLFFSEMPAMETFAGGALVLAAILGNIAAELRDGPTAEAV